MKINGKDYTQNVPINDSRTGWRVGRSAKTIRNACDAWLEKKGLTQKKRPFGKY